MTVTFHNVTIVVNADNPHAAYDDLCEWLGLPAQEGQLEYETDTYSTDTDETVRSTSDLFPE